jgi:hypothetical protein
MLMDEIEENYTKQGYRPEAIRQIKDTLRQNRDRLEKETVCGVLAHCADRGPD